MTSKAQAPERQIYVGLAKQLGQEVAPVGLLKLARHGVMESGESDVWCGGKCKPP